MTSLPGDHGRDKHKIPSSSSHIIQCWKAASSSQDGVMDDDNNDTLLDELREHFLLQEIMPTIEQDLHAKFSKTDLVQHTIDVTDHANNSSVVDKTVSTLTLARGRNQPSRPGAFSYAPQGMDSSIVDENFDGTDDFCLGGGDAEAPANNQEGLAVADLVEGRSLQFALPDADKPLPQRKDKTKQRKTFILLSFLFLLAIGAILVAVLLPSPSATPAQESNYAVENLTSVSVPPSQAPTSRKEYVLSLLPEETLHIIFHDYNAPQTEAYSWLLDDDLLHDMPEEQIKQRFALATLYFATNGSEWTNNTNWLNHSVNECDWYTSGEFFMQKDFSALFPGFVSGFYSSAQLPVCDQNGLYKHLWLDQNNLAGSLPKELYMLTHLRTISMIFNGLHGSISTEIGMLSSLEGLALMYMANAGAIPTQIGNLRLISIEGNDHLGTIPNEFWQLTQLEYVNLSRNPQLNGSLPTELGNFLNLSWLYLDGAGFTGWL